MNFNKKIITTIMAVSAVISITACSSQDVKDIKKDLNDITVSSSQNDITVSSSQQAVPTDNNSNNSDVTSFSGDNDRFYRSMGEAQVEHANAQHGKVTYEPLDVLGRATGAYGYITKDMYEKAKGHSPTINVNPTGWQKNKKVTITANGHSYNGWFYNRSHLVADSLGGSVDAENLITGTRMQNVGWNDRKGGMAYLEEKTRQFLEKNKGCDVYYSSKPNYIGQELLARTVTVDVQSCDKKLNERVIVDNVAPGYTIDYSTGKYSKD